MRTHLTFIFILLLIMAYQPLSAQQKVLVSGTVYDTSRLYVVPFVKVFSTSGAETETDSLGVYHISVPSSDSIYFFYNDKNSITYPVKDIYDQSHFDIAIMAPARTKYKVLQPVTVFSDNYRMDSLENRQQYASIFNNSKPHLSTSDGGATGVPGLDLNSVVGLFQFRKNKQRKLFEQRLVTQEQDGYVDYRFNPKLITRITGLKGDTLKAYIKAYKPDYDFVVNSTLTEFYEYILRSSRIFKAAYGIKENQ